MPRRARAALRDRDAGAQRRGIREAGGLQHLEGVSAGELDLYDRAKIAEQDARGALSLAERTGWEGGRAEGLREAIRALCQAFEIDVDAEREAGMSRMGINELKELQARLLRDRRWS